MRKLIVLFLAGALVSSALASTSEDRARAHHPTKYRFDEIQFQATVQQSEDWPAVGSTNVTAAVIKAKVTVVKTGNVRVHRGAYRHYNTITGHPTPNTYTISGRGQTYFARGSAIVTYQGTVEVQPDLSVVVTGSGKIVDGTGDHRNARGRFTFRSVAPSPDAPYTTHLVGTARY